MDMKSYTKALGVLFLAIALAAGGGLVFAQTFHTMNQATVGWDAVTTNEDGTPLGENDVVKYRMYISNAVTDPDKANPAEITPDSDGDGTLDPISDTQFTVTLNVEGKFFFGVKAERYVDGNFVGDSIISWSDNPAIVANGETFGLQYFLPPAKPGGLSIQ